MLKRTTIILFVSLISILASAKEPEKGYRGFVELNTELYVDKGFSYAIDGFPVEWKDNYWLYGVSTTHGYQFNPHFFLGGGIWFQFGAGEAEKTICEVLFVQTRTDWTFGKVPLYADIRIGGNLGKRRMGHYISDEIYTRDEKDEILASFTIGYRYDFGKKIKLNFGAGVSFHGCRYETKSFGSWQWKPFTSVKIGIEF